MGKDYYKTLGVDKEASQDEIKKAFRKKAHQYHPDKAGGDEAKFKEVNEAYQVLGDQKKRAQYDQYGSAFEDAQAGGGFGGFDGFRDFSNYANGFNVNMDDIGDIFGGIGDIFGFGGGRGQGKRARRGNDMQTVLTIEFREAVFGVEKELALKKNIVCKRCKGNMAEPGSKIETCSTCKGSGRVTGVQRTILGNIQVQRTCEACGGEGKTYEKLCGECGGSGISEDIVKLKVKIPAGIDDGESIRLAGQGEAGEKGAPAGNLYIKVRVKGDNNFERDGYNIKSTLKMSFRQAVLGGKIDVETVEGPVKLKIPAGTQSGTVFKLRGKGISRLRASGRGDHFVTAQIITPRSLNRKQKRLIEELDL